MSSKLTELFKKSKQFDEDLTEWVKSEYPNISEESLIFLIRRVNTDNYLQILYSFGIDYLKMLLRFFEGRDDYDTCIIIRDTVEKQNKATGSTFKLKEYV